MAKGNLLFGGSRNSIFYGRSNLLIFGLSPPVINYFNGISHWNASISMLYGPES
jgi:hypothetical protein